MIIYNVTINIDSDVAQEWVSWMKAVHIPDVLATGKFTGHRFLKLTTEVEHMEGETYAIQYYCNSHETLGEYFEHHAEALRHDVAKRYKDKFVAFRTVLEEV